MPLLTGLEANANIMLPEGKGRMQGAIGRFMDDVYLMVDPTGREADIGNTALQKASTIGQIIWTLRQANPGMSPYSYAVQAHGIYMGPDRADRFLDVLAKAEELDDGSPKAPPEELSEDFKVAFADKCSNETDEDARVIWAKLLNGERERPGTFSKRTMDILSTLDKTTIGRFQKLCSVCLGDVKGIGVASTEKPIPLLMYDGETKVSYDDGLLLVTDIRELEAAGLLFCGLRSTFSRPEYVLFGINGDPYAAKSEEGGDVKISFDEAVLSDAGCQLSNLCSVGCCEGLPALFAKKVRKDGFTPFKLTPSENQGTFVLEEMEQ